MSVLGNQTGLPPLAAVAASPPGGIPGVSAVELSLLAVLFSSLTVLGVIGNCLVIVAIAADVKMRACVMNILLLNLAVADLSNLIVAVAEWSPIMVFGTPAWLLPDVLCPFARYLECVFLFTSISTQLVVCVERYIATAHAMRARSLCSRQHALLAVAASWAAAAAFASPYAITNAVRQPTGVCTNMAASSAWWPHYKLLEFVLYFFLPCSLILIVYSKVAAVLWDANPRLKVEGGSACMEMRSAKQLSTRRSVVKMLVACAVVYFVCYAPIQALTLSKFFFPSVSIRPPIAVRFLLNALAVTCSASNPLLYALFSTRFRKRLRLLLASGFNRYTALSTGTAVLSTQPRPSMQFSGI